MNNIEITRIAEDSIDSNLLTQIAELRQECFPDSGDGRAYFKQIPHFRYVLFMNKNLIGQVGIDHRIMNFDGEVKRIFGVISLCVTKKHRGHGLASQMLDVIMKDASASQIDMILLMAKNPSLYRKNGFEYTNAECKWLGIDDKNLVSIGVLVEFIESELMVKHVTSSAKQYENIDFLGYMF